MQKQGVARDVHSTVLFTLAGCAVTSFWLWVDSLSLFLPVTHPPERSFLMCVCVYVVLCLYQSISSFKPISQSLCWTKQFSNTQAAHQLHLRKIMFNHSVGTKFYLFSRSDYLNISIKSWLASCWCHYLYDKHDACSYTKTSKVFYYQLHFTQETQRRHCIGTSAPGSLNAGCPFTNSLKYNNTTNIK